jgi:hypothetical protein
VVALAGQVSQVEGGQGAGGGVKSALIVGLRAAGLDRLAVRKPDQIP